MHAPGRIYWTYGHLSISAGITSNKKGQTGWRSRHIANIICQLRPDETGVKKSIWTNPHTTAVRKQYCHIMSSACRRTNRQTHRRTYCFAQNTRTDISERTYRVLWHWRLPEVREHQLLAATRTPDGFISRQNPYASRHHRVLFCGQCFSKWKKN